MYVCMYVCMYVRMYVRTYASPMPQAAKLSTTPLGGIIYNVHVCMYLLPSACYMYVYVYVYVCVGGRCPCPP
jgi:hypothetical protein